MTFNNHPKSTRKNNPLQIYAHQYIIFNMHCCYVFDYHTITNILVHYYKQQVINTSN